MRPAYPRSIAPLIGLLVFFLAATGALADGTGAKRGDYLGPRDVVVSSDGKTLFTACSDAGSVLWVRLPGGDVVRRVELPAEPTGLALTPDGSKLIVTCAAPKSAVAVLDAGTGSLLGTIAAGHTAVSPVVSPNGRRLYVCNRFDGDVSVIDLGRGRLVARVPVVREPIAAAVTPDGRTLLVANHLPNSRTDKAFLGAVAPVVTAVDVRTRQTAAIELPHGANGLQDLAISPDGRHAVVTHLFSNFEELPFRVDMGWINTNVVSVIDVRQQRVIGTIGLDENDLGAGNPHGVAFTPDGKSVCVSVAGTHELFVIDTADLLGDFARRTMQPMMRVWPIYLSLGRSLWQRHALPGKGPRGLAAAGSTVYVAEYFSDAVAVVGLHASDGASIERLRLGPEPQMTPERRGELLFHDATICYQQWLSCASCHPDGRGDALNWDLMNDGTGNSKNTKSMLFSHRTPPSMAEGVRESAEAAVRAGLAHILFADRPEEEAAAIDAYLKSLRPVPSPRLVDGRLGPAAERGRQLFSSERINCQRCHPPPLYTDLKAHDVGTAGRNARNRRFDTPTLVEVWRTAPYLHDGRFTTVRELLAEGKHGLHPGPHGELTGQELDDLVEFVLSL